MAINTGDLLDLIKQQQGYIYTSIPASILSYDSETQLCSVQISVKRPHFSKSATNPVIINDVPVGFYYGHDWVIASTLKKGDSVLLVFPMFDISVWMNSDKESVTQSDGYRFHNIDGAFALPITFTFNSPTRDQRFKDIFHIVQGDNYITLDDTGVDIVSGDTEVLIDQSGDITMNTTHCTINADTTINGHLDIRDTISARGESGGSGAVCTITGDVDIINGDLDVQDGSISDHNTNLTTHVHAENDGGNTGTPI